jgi:hypothetical protein
MDAMRWFWVVLGIVLILLGLLDLFLTALDYDESGFLTFRLRDLQWHALRGIIRHLPEPWRSFYHAQIVGLQILLSMVVWFVILIVGFGFVYYGMMYGHNFKFSGDDIGPSMDYAIYFSTAQLSTVGTSGVTPQNTLLRALSVVETLFGLSLITLAITFLINVYQTISHLLTLSAAMYNSSPGTTDPVSSLAIYFPKGQAKGLEGYLDRLYQGLGAYFNGLRLHHIAYYYQSRTTRVTITYAVYMLGGIVAALRWGLPEQNAAADDPTITLLTEQFMSFLSYLEKHFQGSAADHPSPRPYETFVKAYEGNADPDDHWLDRFNDMDRRMRQIVCSVQGPDPHEAYRRYVDWLPFAHRTETAVDRLARDLASDPRQVKPAPRLRA